MAARAKLRHHRCRRVIEKYASLTSAICGIERLHLLMGVRVAWYRDGILFIGIDILYLEVCSRAAKTVLAAVRGNAKRRGVLSHLHHVWHPLARGMRLAASSKHAKCSIW